jgi:hypothetical protein
MVIIAIYGREMPAEPLFEREKIVTLKPYGPEGAGPKTAGRDLRADL